MTQLTHNPLAQPPAPRFAEPVRASWLDMARDGLGWTSGAPRVVIDDASSFLNRAIEHGRAIKEQLDAMPEAIRERQLSTPQDAMRLRIYLAAAGGQLADELTVSGAMRRLGIADEHGRTRGVWK